MKKLIETKAELLTFVAGFSGKEMAFDGVKVAQVAPDVAEWFYKEYALSNSNKSQRHAFFDYYNAHISDFIHGYKLALLWSSGDGEGNQSYEAFELSPEAVAECEKDCREFIAVAAPLLLQYAEKIKSKDYSSWDMAGHDFWLTRAGHGVGYGDRGLDDLGDQLSALCGYGAQFGNKEAYLGADNLVYLS